LSSLLGVEFGRRVEPVFVVARNLQRGRQQFVNVWRSNLGAILEPTGRNSVRHKSERGHGGWMRTSGPDSEVRNFGIQGPLANLKILVRF
jgi:hypothetical protein